MLLVGLGSSREGGGDSLFVHADELRRRGAFAETAVGLITAAPSIAAGLGKLSSGIVYVVPFLMCDGYLAHARIPQELRALASPERDFRLCRPIGSDSRLSALLAERAAAICREKGLPPATATAVVVGHGTPGAPASSEAVRAHVACLVASGTFESVRPAFLQEAPFLPDVLRASMGPTVVVGLFAGRGMHAGEDVPRAIAEAHTRVGVPLIDAGPIGTHPGCAEIIVAATDVFDAENVAPSAT